MRDIRSRLREGVQVHQRHGFFTDEGWVPVGVTDQFMENAADYEALRTLPFVESLECALRAAAVDRTAPLQILDIGSGGGSSALAAAALLPASHIVASDISKQLLTILNSRLSSDETLRSRIDVCCFDLHQPFFAPEQFDLVIGFAILHHLADPLAALQNVVYALKPGGKVILNEPLEAGNMLLYVLYERIIAFLFQEGVTDGPLITLLRAIRRDFQHRLGVPELKPWTVHLDDKWLFDEPYLQRLAQQLHFQRHVTHPGIVAFPTVFEISFRALLEESGIAHADVSSGVWEIVREFDRSVSDRLKAQTPPTGYIVFENYAGSEPGRRNTENSHDR